MKKLLKNIFVILIFVFVENTNAQINDLEIFKSLSDDLSVQKSNEPNIPNDEILENEPTLNKAKIDNFYDEDDYSYTGDDSFDQSPDAKSLTNRLRYFGYDYFQDAPSTFAQIKNIPIPPDYLIGPGDNIKVILFGKENREFTLEVNRTGEIYFPEIGPIYLAGLSFTEMKDTVQTIVDSQITGTKVNITLGALRNIDVFILGSAYNPGMYTVSALSSLTNAIFASGGVKQNGSLRNIQHKRNGEIISKFDFYDLLLNGNNKNDSRLASGDVIFIPSVEKTVGITGEVYSPGIYEVLPDETLDDLIDFAGNFKPKANTRSIEILRVNKAENGFDLFESDADENNKKELIHGDVVSVFPITNSLKKAILIRGHYGKPGFHPWKSGDSLQTIISSDDLLPNTDLNYVLIKRKNKQNKYVFLQADIQDLLSSPNEINQVKLNEKDEIIFLPRLLTENQITTKLIENIINYKNDSSKMSENTKSIFINEENFNSPSIFRMSLEKTEDDRMQSEIELDNQILVNNQSLESNQIQASNQNANTNKMTNLNEAGNYYEYSVFNYCNFSAGQAKEIFKPGYSLSLDTDEKAKAEKEIALASLCRKQIIKPLLDMIKQQNDTGNELSVITMMGNVKFPGKYPFSNGMSFSDGIKTGGGLKSGSYNSEIEVTRQSKLEKSYSSNRIVSDLKSSLEKKLRPMDIINVKEILNEEKIVKITGEVYFEGEYPISEGETINDIIKRAGGIKQEASTVAAVFTRERLKEDENKILEESQEDLKRMIVLANQSQSTGVDRLGDDDLERILSLVTSTKESTGRLVIDLDSIMGGFNTDIILENGDHLHIPKKKNTIRVIGEVFVPNIHIFDSDQTIDDYIELSGGLTKYSNSSTTYLIKADGSITPSNKLSGDGFFRGSANTLEAGDTIVIPLNTERVNNLRAASEITQIIYQMAVAAAAVQSFN